MKRLLKIFLFINLFLAPVYINADTKTTNEQTASSQSGENKGKEAWDSTVSFFKAAWDSTKNAVKGIVAKTKEGYARSKESFSEWLARKENKTATADTENK